MRAFRFVAVMILIAGCSHFQSGPTMSPSDHVPTGLQQSDTLKNSSIHYDASVLKVGTPRSRVQAAFGDPSATGTDPAGHIEDAYAFNSDGTKSVNPPVLPRFIAMAAFSPGVSVEVWHTHLALAQHNLTVYSVLYNSDQTIASVRVVKPSKDEPMPR